MIPAYSEEVKITVVERSSDKTLEQQVADLREQVRQLQETVEYINRERSRLKSDLESLRYSINKS
jgi:predicted RNase H-like nuclease (RuvC/YqgF family)